MIETNTGRALRITVIGGNGGIGRQAVELALKLGHHVTAVLRNPVRLQLTHPNLKIVQGDVLTPGSLDPHVYGADAVISAIGTSSLKATTLYSQGSRNILSAMEQTGVKRVFFISAAGIEVNPTHSLIVRLATRYILQRVLKHMYADIERMEDVVKESTSDWTIVRPPRLTDKALTQKYKIAINRHLTNPMTISRADVAHYMIDNIKSSETFRATVEVASHNS